MVDILYLLFSGLLLTGFFLAPRKEVPFVVMVHALVQYALTQVFWFNNLSGRGAALLLLFMSGSSVVLIWVRRMNYSQEQKQLQGIFRIASWGLLLSVVVVMWVRNPYVFEMPVSSGRQTLAGGWGIQPFGRLAGNALMFLLVGELVFGWGRRWTLGASLGAFGPMVLYAVMMGLAWYWLPGDRSLLVFQEWFVWAGLSC